MEDYKDSADKDEFHIMDSLKVIWMAKYVIILIAMVSAAATFLYAQNLPKKYVSYIQINSNNLFFLKREEEILLQLKGIAFDIETYNQWHAQRSGSKLDFEFLAPNVVVDDFLYSKTFDEMNFKLRNASSYTQSLGFSGHVFEISNAKLSPELYLEIFDYVNYAIRVLSEELVTEAELMLAAYRQNLPEDLSSLSFAKQKFELEYFLQKAEFGVATYDVSLPTVPNKVSGDPLRYASVVSILSVIFASLLALFRESLKNTYLKP